VAFSYDHEKQLLELQATNGRITSKAAAAELEELTEAEISRLEKCSDTFAHDPVMRRGYLTMATELRDHLVTEKAQIAELVKAAPARNLRVLVDSKERKLADRVARVEKVISGDPLRRPIGMPPSPSGVAADLTKGAPLIAPARRYRPSKPTKEMTRPELADHYVMLSREADTPAHAHELLKLATALRKEGD